MDIVGQAVAASRAVDSSNDGQHDRDGLSTAHSLV